MFFFVYLKAKRHKYDWSRLLHQIKTCWFWKRFDLFTIDFDFYYLLPVSVSAVSSVCFIRKWLIIKLDFKRSPLIPVTLLLSSSSKYLGEIQLSLLAWGCSTSEAGVLLLLLPSLPNSTGWLTLRWDSRLEVFPRETDIFYCLMQILLLPRLVQS